MGRTIGDERYRAMIGVLVEARKARGLTQDELGRLLGRPQQYVGRYEIFERRLDVIEYVDAARLLGLDGFAEARGIYEG